jgi:hypothetical protein
VGLKAAEARADYEDRPTAVSRACRGLVLLPGEAVPVVINVGSDAAEIYAVVPEVVVEDSIGTETIRDVVDGTVLTYATESNFTCYRLAAHTLIPTHGIAATCI